jgi:solute carrier family 35 protein F5
MLTGGAMAQVLLLPLVYAYHRMCDFETRRLARTEGLGFVGVLQRHSVLPMRKLLGMAAFLNGFYCFADYFWYAALANVSVAASTAIFNCSPFFVYCFSICFLRERASVRKLAGVLMSFVGVALIVLFQDGSAPLDASALNNDDDDGESSLLASVLVVISAAVYGAYEVAFCVVLGDDLEDSSTLLILTGLCGLFSIPMWIAGSFLFSWCPIAALHEPLGWPVAGEAVTMLVLSGTLAGAYTLLLSLALCWTTPLETAVGCMLTIPLAGLWDVAINGTVFSWECVLGSFLVMAGFGVLECCAPKPKVDVEHTAVDVKSVV